ncbi:MAG TPA: ATP-binding protein [Candidatus Acidoferrum sp.]|nr:ATP-binding protein [Candidatus Acidoferrum sp.]
MGSLLYIRLIGYTAGTLLQLFWMVVILGYRRQRNFERVFFFLCLALFFFYGGSLLALNSQIYYPLPPAALNEFAIAIITVGLCLLPALLLHLHMEYAETRGLLKSKRWKAAVFLIFYAACLHLAYHRIPPLLQDLHFNFLEPGSSLGHGFAIVLAVALAWCGGWERRFATAAPDKPQRYFHWTLLVFFAVSVLAVAGLHLAPLHLEARTAGELATAFSLLPILPFSVLIFLVYRHNFLQIGRQKNLLYAISATFLALLYLSLVRRLSLRLEPVLPPEATASILLFVLVIFIEPLQRALGRRLQETAQKEMDLAHRLASEIQQEARRGDVPQLADFIESRLKEQFEFAEVGLMLWHPGSGEEGRLPARKEFREGFSILHGNQTIGSLLIEPHGAAVSGETRRALEFLCEQLPGALDLCRAIEEKLRLERELAERERLAVLGQMAASISHNLKNPLGSMKTILQVQLENPEMPESMRAETKMILEEIGRLSAKLNQLLQFSRPAVLGEGRPARCNAFEVAREVVGVLRPEAQRKGVALELHPAATALSVAISTEALNDILTNLVVNALDAAARGGHVHVGVSRKDGNGFVEVEDDGPGVPSELRGKILQPFFTTKTQGTGLGLAIVARRASDAGGKLEFESPVKNGRGTRFLVWLPLGEETR